MALGARKALADAKKLQGVLALAAADGQKEALELIKKGEYFSPGLNDPALVARTAVEYGVKAVNGQLPSDIPRLTYNAARCDHRGERGQVLQPEGRVGGPRRVWEGRGACPRLPRKKPGAATCPSSSASAR